MLRPADDHLAVTIVVDAAYVAVESRAIALTSRSERGSSMFSDAVARAYLWLIASYSSRAVAVTFMVLSFQRMA